MQYYTKEQIIDDISAFEGCEIKITVAKLENAYNLVFFKPYSEYYAKPLPDTATVDDLNARMKKYCDTNSIPEVDIPADENDYLTLYGYNIEKGIHERVEVYEDEDDVKARLKNTTGSNAYAMKYNTVLLVDGNHEAIQFLTKTLN